MSLPRITVNWTPLSTQKLSDRVAASGSTVGSKVAGLLPRLQVDVVMPDLQLDRPASGTMVKQGWS